MIIFVELKIDFNTCPNISVGNNSIEFVGLARNLGLILDPTLSWNNHVSKIVSKVHSSLFSLKVHRHSLSINLRIKLVQSLIFSNFDYSCVAFFSLDKEQNERLEKTLNSCIRFIFRIPRFFHITPHRRQLNWHTANNRRKYFLGLLKWLPP